MKATKTADHSKHTAMVHNAIPVMGASATRSEATSSPVHRGLYLALLGLPALLYGALQLSAVMNEAELGKPQECFYLSHLALSGQYQQNKDGSGQCQSLVRYFGDKNQHSIRYKAIGQQGVMQEMRLSLRIGQEQRARGINQLMRYGQSLALPVLGHTMPAEVGQFLRDGRVGHWDYPQASLSIEHHRYPVPQPRIVAADEFSSGRRTGHEDIELVFRRMRLH